MKVKKYEKKNNCEFLLEQLVSVIFFHLIILLYTNIINIIMRAKAGTFYIN